MRSQKAGPKWCQLYLVFPLLILLFLLDHELRITPGEHEIVQIGIALIVYGLMYWWIKADSRAISRMDQQPYGKFRVIHIPPPRTMDVSYERHPLLQLPESEVKGLLSDTFEVGCPDAEALSIDDIPQEIKKE